MNTYSLTFYPRMLILLPLIILSLYTRSSAQAMEWETSEDYKFVEPIVIHKGKWLANNATDKEWNKNLQYVIRWGYGVPYLNVSLFKKASTNFDHILSTLKKDRDKEKYIAPIETFMLATSIVYHIENRNLDPIEGIMFILEQTITYYQNLKKSYPHISYAIFETLIQLQDLRKLEQYIRTQPN